MSINYERYQCKPGYVGNAAHISSSLNEHISCYMYMHLFKKFESNILKISDQKSVSPVQQQQETGVRQTQVINKS